MLEFGVEPDRENAHTIRGELIAPFGRAALLLKSGSMERPSRPAPLSAPGAEAGLPEHG